MMFFKNYKSSFVLGFLGACQVLCVGASSLYGVTNPATQNVSISFPPFYFITAAPTLVNMTTAVDAQTGISSATSSGANLTYSTNTTGAKITASVTNALPAGITLGVSAAPATVTGGPTGSSPGTASAINALGTTALSLITGISTTYENTCPITYTVTAQPSAGATVASPLAVTVTYTISAGT